MLGGATELDTRGTGLGGTGPHGDVRWFPVRNGLDGQTVRTVRQNRFRLVVADAQDPRNHVERNSDH